MVEKVCNTTGHSSVVTMASPDRYCIQRRPIVALTCTEGMDSLISGARWPRKSIGFSISTNTTSVLLFSDRWSVGRAGERDGGRSKMQVTLRIRYLHAVLVEPVPDTQQNFADYVRSSVGWVIDPDAKLEID